MPKELKNYRLSEEALAAIDAIAKKLGLTQTAVIEMAVREVARRENLKAHADLIAESAQHVAEQPTPTRSRNKLVPVAQVVEEIKTMCPHPAGLRRGGRANWTCTACGHQHKSS